MRLVFLGTPEIAISYLQALVGAGHEIALVITGADKRRGRGRDLSPSPVKAAATELGLPVSHTVDDVVATDCELGVVVAFGQIIKPHVLDVVPMINVHFSLLPRWRGAAPVERAILAGDEVTGVDIMRVEEGLDTGDVYAGAEVPIGPSTTAPQLRETLVGESVRLLTEQLVMPVSDWIDDGTPQSGETTYAKKLASSEFEIDWSRSPVEVHRLIRIGGAWTMFRGKRLKILAADLSDDRLAPTSVQPEGKSAMSFDAWRNGAQPTPDEQFGPL